MNAHPPLLRAVFVACGCLALLLGLIGIFLPVLPTTPFILLAAACFARGSRRLHGYLLSHRLVGPVVRSWEEHRSMPPGIKPWAFFMLALSFGVSIYLMDVFWHRLMLAALGAALALILWRVPVRKS